MQRRYIITKIISCLFMIITMLAFIVPALALADQASDISNHWVKEQITGWVNKGIIKGYSDGTFKPENQISRAEFMALINGAAGFTKKAAINYKDVPAGAWYADVVAKAKAAGYISGYEDGTIRPNSPISRQEAAIVIMKVSKLEPNAAAAEKMKDVKRLVAWSKGAVGALINAKIMVGYPDGTFKGENPVNRAEAVILLKRALGEKTAGPSNPAAVYDKAGTFGPVTGTDTLKGNVTISAKDVTLQNVIVEGDLTIDKAVGDGSVTLKKVTVKGTTYVNGTTEISQLIAQSSVKVQESADLTGKGVEDLIVEKTVSSSTEVTVDGVKIAALQIKAAGVIVNTDKNTRINSLVADAAARITGTGTIDKASINTSGVVFDVMPATMTVAQGISTPSISSTGGDSDSSTEVTSTNVATAAELTAALANTNITTIRFAADITASPVVTRSVTIDFGDYMLIGDLSFSHSGTGTSVLSGSAGTRIIGNLSVDTGNASFTNGVTVSGTVNVINVEIGTWTEKASGNK